MFLHRAKSGCDATACSRVDLAQSFCAELGQSLWGLTGLEAVGMLAVFARSGECTQSLGREILPTQITPVCNIWLSHTAH